MTPTEIVQRDISFGPLKTEHHIHTMDERFRRSFLSFVEARILPQVEGQFSRVEGQVTSLYDDPKYFGPRSAVRFRYFYEFRFHSPDGVETVRGKLDYDPTTGSFTEGRQRHPQVDSFSAQRKRKDMMAMVGAISERYRAGERDIVCPYCGSALSIWYLQHRDFIKDIRCPTKGCLNVHFD